MDKKKIVIVGAGLCGTLLAIRLGQRGYEVSLHERRGDMRKEEMAAGRSINLALSARGLMALDRVGLKDKVLEYCIPMHGRMIHTKEGETFLSPYSGRVDDYINSVPRGGLNCILLDEAEKMDNVTIHFNSSCKSVDLKNAKATFQQPNEWDVMETGEILIGTDGAGSVVRRSMMSKTTALLFNYSQNFLRHGYKELSILPADDGGYRIEKNALHIWPRGSFMIIALPNMDGSFTLTMFHPYGGEAGFNTLAKKEEVLTDFFEEYYPDLLPHVPHYIQEYKDNPVGTLGTIKCYPWQAYGKTLIMGDAAHAIVPFYGQGMNASFEDVRVFDDMLDEYGDGDWELLLSKFQDARAENANAIADLAIDNFHEMQDKVNDPAFQKKRKLEMKLEQNHPEYYSKYSLVTFKPEMTYSEAMKKGRAQDELLLEICHSTDDVSSLDEREILFKLSGV